MLKKRNLIILSFLFLGIFSLSSCFLQPHSTEGLLKGQVLVPEGTLKHEDLTGEALPDATVNIIDLETGAIIATTTTDANGYYQVFVPPGGPYLLEVVKEGLKLEQLTCVVEAGNEYDLGTADCVTTAAALIAQAMMDAGDDPADIDCETIIADTNFSDVSSMVCSIIQAGEDPTVSAAVLQAVEDFLNPPEPPTPSDAKAITTFAFKALDPEVVGVVNEEAKTIALTVPFGTEVTALVPTIVHTGVSISPASGVAQDFTSTVTYMVTAEDASTQAYLVSVTEEITVINISAIPGVTAPVLAAIPVTAITPTDQYTGTVTWYPTDDPFQEDKIYIATITLTPKAGFTLTGVPANFFTVAGAIIVTNTTNSDEVTAVFPESPGIGDSYGGGIIAYILQNGDPGYVAGEFHGLIATTADAPSRPDWSNILDSSAGAYGQAIGTGQANTAAIVGQAGCTSGSAYYCYHLTEGGYDDWFLPSKDELNKLYLNKDAIGGFVDDFYWSSSEDGAYGAWGQYFYNGHQEGYAKVGSYYFRAIRYF